MHLSLQELLQQTLRNDAVRWWFIGPLLLILLDVWSGIAAAFARGKFTFRKFGAFLDQDLRKYIVVSLMVAGVYLAGGEDRATTSAAALGMTVLALHVIASIISNVCEGLGIPSIPLGPLERFFPGLSTVVEAAEGPTTPPELPIEARDTGPAPIVTPALTLPVKPSASTVKFPEHL